jgi:hypothetical protein
MKVIYAPIDENFSALQGMFSVLKSENPHVVVFTGINDSLFEPMNKEMRKYGYSTEKLGGGERGYLQGEMFIYTMDEWCTRLHKYYKKFSRTYARGGWIHFSLAVSGGGTYDIVCAQFDENINVKREQLVELSHYVGGMEKCVVCANACILKWHEPPLFVPEGFVDMWREYGNETNKYNVQDCRPDRIWIPLNKIIKGEKYDIVKSGYNEHLPLKIEVL